MAVSLVRHKDNKPLYFIAQIEDINDLKQSEQENQRLMERPSSSGASASSYHRRQ
ncbi:hypothetical protein MJM99_28855 [Salmonella enterica subsp. enterica serovar Kentucky]|nr:hypothetical protein [Salmonella enterica subsp. enterica serovar Kentucky]